LKAIQYANQTVVGRRLEVFEQVAPKLNKLLCFFAFVGRWKEITPNEVLILKRDADEVMFTNRLLFSDALFGAYQAFTERFFAMFATVDGDALIRARIASSLGDRRRLPWWNPDMAAMFARQLTCEPADAQLAYDQLSAARSASSGDRLNLSTGVELTGSTRGGIPPVDRFLSRIAAVPPPPVAICSKTSKRENIASAASISRSSRSQFKTPAPLGVNAQATAKVLRVVLERDSCAIGAHVWDVHNPSAGGSDVHSPLGALCHTPIGSSGPAPMAAMGVPLSLTRKGALSA
jgi:hypothetical protein